MKLIVAMSRKDGIIGINNKLPWNLPTDLQFFKEKTNSRNILMGRNTWESLPVKPLPNRQNYIISSKMNPDEQSYNIISDVSRIKDSEYKDAYIIGGAQLYEYAIKHELVDEMFITVVEYEPDSITDNDSITTMKLPNLSKFGMVSMTSYYDGSKDSHSHVTLHYITL